MVRNVFSWCCYWCCFKDREEEMKQMGMFDFQARDFLEEIKSNYKVKLEGEGGACPCCDRWGKVNPFKLTETMALALRWIQLNGKESGWVNVQKTAPRWILRSKTYPVLAHWEFIEAGGSRDGTWRITKKGLDFIAGFISVPHKVYIYNNKVWDFSDKNVSFRGCFGSKFDFHEMMSDRYDWNKVRSSREKKK